MSTYEYQVEYEDDHRKTHVETYDNRKVAAVSRARAKSEKHGVAYVVACKYNSDNRAYFPCGHKSFADGLTVETEGEGF